MQPETSTIALQTTQSDLKAEAIASKGKDDKTAFADKSLQAPQNNTEEKVVASDFTMGYNTVSYCFPIYQSNDDNHSVLDTKQSISATLPLEIMQPTVAAVNK